MGEVGKTPTEENNPNGGLRHVGIGWMDPSANNGEQKRFLHSSVGCREASIQVSIDLRKNKSFPLIEGNWGRAQI